MAVALCVCCVYAFLFAYEGGGGGGLLGTVGGIRVFVLFSSSTWLGSRVVNVGMRVSWVSSRSVRQTKVFSFDEGPTQDVLVSKSLHSSRVSH